MLAHVETWQASHTNYFSCSESHSLGQFSIHECLCCPAFVPYNICKKKKSNEYVRAPITTEG